MGMATIRVRYGETDQMGIVYHGNYFTWFEVGRSEFFRSLGMSYREMEDMGVILPVISAQCDFIVAAKYDDLINIKTKVNMLRGVKLEFKYDVIRCSDNKLLATGTTLHAFVDKALKPVNPRKQLPEVLRLLENQIEEE